jgi:hypothetical protein
MKMKRIYIYLAMMVAAGLTACSSSEEVKTDSGDKTPIDLAASLSATGTASRAANAAFVSGDKVVVGLRNSGSTDYTTAPYFKKTEFTVASDKTSLSSPVLYWDDFSTSTNDLKVGGEKTLDVLYGVCLNGGADATTIANDGTFSWTTAANQSTATKTNDLLLANTLKKVSYSRTAADRIVTIPFSHVMSEVTINLTASDGYSTSAANFSSSTVTLQNMNSACSVDAKNTSAPLSGNGTPVNVTMCKTTSANTTATYQAIVVPGTALAAGQTLATITGVNGNNYNIVLSDAILGDAVTAGTWNNNLSSGAMKSGVNYVLNVTLKKQTISVTATVADWSTANATATGTIKFTADGTTQGSTSATESAFTDAFTVYSNGTTATDAGYVKGSLFTNDGTNYSTTTPMYWNGNDDSRYFRTAIYSSSTKTAEAAPSIENGEVKNIIAEAYSAGKDILWGTNGDTKYNATSTEAVKMHFSHALAKVTVALATSASTDADYVDLSNVDHITITGVQTTGGVLSLHTGAITSTDATADLAISGANKEYLVLPQATISSTSKLVVTMKDGTTYSVNMNTGLRATTWVKGTSYTYTVTMKKSAVTFSAQVKDWDTFTGSGAANMDWD